MLAAGDAPPRAAHGYGPDPDIVKTYHPGELWPPTSTADQRRLATALGDLMIPADATVPALQRSSKIACCCVPLSSYDGPADEVLRHLGLLP